MLFILLLTNLLASEAALYSKNELETLIKENSGLREPKLSIVFESKSICPFSVELVHLKESCGASGCEYYISRQVKGKYAIIGTFFGNYKFSANRSLGCQEIEVTTNSGLELGRQRLIFNGEKYVAK